MPYLTGAPAVCKVRQRSLRKRFRGQDARVMGSRMGWNTQCLISHLMSFTTSSATPSNLQSEPGYEAPRLIPPLPARAFGVTFPRRAQVAPFSSQDFRRLEVLPERTWGAHPPHFQPSTFKGRNRKKATLQSRRFVVFFSSP